MARSVAQPHIGQNLNIETACEGKTVKVEGEQAFSLAERGFADYTEAELTTQWLQRSFVTEASIGAGIEITAQVRFANTGAFGSIRPGVCQQQTIWVCASPLYKLSAPFLRLS